MKKYLFEGSWDYKIYEASCPELILYKGKRIQNIIKRKRTIIEDSSNKLIYYIIQPSIFTKYYYIYNSKNDVVGKMKFLGLFNFFFPLQIFFNNESYQFIRDKNQSVFSSNLTLIYNNNFIGKAKNLKIDNYEMIKEIECESKDVLLLFIINCAIDYF